MNKIGAWLHITDKCNLNCTYCYFPHEPVTMSTDVGQASIDSIFRSAQKHKASSVHIKFVGGEPLLEFEKLTSFINYANQRSKETNISLDALVITNALLLNLEKIKTLKKLGTKLTISLDGLGKYNKERISTEGKSTVQKVVEAIELAIAHDYAPHISIVVGERNIEGLPSFVKWLLEHNLKFNFTLVRKNEYSPEMKAFEEAKIIKGFLETFEVIKENLPPYSLTGSISDKMNVLFPHKKTCGAGHNYLVFDTNGKIAKCQMQIKETVSSYQSEDPIADIQNDTKFVRSFDVDEIEECKTCEIRYFCTGGCPMETFNKTGKYKAKSPNCNIYKAIFPELLKVEAQHLLA